MIFDQRYQRSFVEFITSSNFKGFTVNSALYGVQFSYLRTYCDRFTVIVEAKMLFFVISIF